MTTLIQFFLLLVLLLLNRANNAADPRSLSSTLIKLKSLEALYDAMASITMDEEYIEGLISSFENMKTKPSNPKFANEFVRILKSEIKSLIRSQCSHLTENDLRQLFDVLKTLSIPRDYCDEIIANKYNVRIQEIDEEEFMKLFQNSFLGIIGYKIKGLKEKLAELRTSEETEKKKLVFLKKFIEKSSSSFDDEFISILENEKLLHPGPHRTNPQNSIVVLFKMELENYFQTKRGNVKLLSAALEGIKILNISSKFVKEVIEDLDELKNGKFTNKNFIKQLKMKFSVHLQHQINMKDLNLKMFPKIE